MTFKRIFCACCCFLQVDLLVGDVQLLALGESLGTSLGEHNAKHTVLESGRIVLNVRISGQLHASADVSIGSFHQVNLVDTGAVGVLSVGGDRDGVLVQCDVEFIGFHTGRVANNLIILVTFHQIHDEERGGPRPVTTMFPSCRKLGALAGPLVKCVANRGK